QDLVWGFNHKDTKDTKFFSDLCVLCVFVVFISLSDLCFRFDIYRDVVPLSLLEANNTQHTPRRVAHKYRDPDVDWVQPACLLDHEADAEGHNYLRDGRDVERTPGVSRSLQSTCVS